LSNKPFLEYQITNANGGVVSFARVIGKIYKFPFMKKKSLHIGPCMTIPEYRGRGFYPMLLRKIQKDFDTDLYMIVHESNLSSIRGVEKARFSLFGKGHSTLLKRYEIDEFV